VSVPRPKLKTDPVRSALMKRIRRVRTSPEERVCALLRELGIRYRRAPRSLPGTPDFANKKGRWAIFVNGCFWHHHASCYRATVPTRNRSFWEAKFADNKRRDKAKIVALKALGFTVLVVWECETTKELMLRRKLLSVKHLGK
jgi:DNA mismatch endonuclease (patch repair protein)